MTSSSLRTRLPDWAGESKSWRGPWENTASILLQRKPRLWLQIPYKGARRISVGGTEFRIAHSDQSVKVLGISFNLQESPSQQAKEILQRVRSAAAAHKDLLRGRASWQRKANMIRTLVESQFSLDRRRSTLGRV